MRTPVRQTWDFETPAKLLRDADEGAVPASMLMPASTDGRLFAKLGIQSYGFLPIELPVGFDFAETIHGSGERIPVASHRVRGRSYLQAIAGLR